MMEFFYSRKKLEAFFSAARVGTLYVCIYHGSDALSIQMRTEADWELRDATV